MPAQVIYKVHNKPINNESNVIYGLFQQSRANYSKATGLIRPEFELVWDLISALVTCKYDKDTINNEGACMETSFSYYNLWEFFSSARIIEVHDPIRLKFELIWDVTHVLDTCTFGEEPITNDCKKVDTPFPHYKSMGDFACHDNHSVDPNYPKHKKAFSPPHWWYTFNLTKTGQLVLKLFMFESIKI